MAVPIKLTTNMLAEVMREFEGTLRDTRFFDGNIMFSKKMHLKDARTKVKFKEKAWDKMQALIYRFDSEVAWHGLVERVNDHEFEVTDILVYPQRVSGATVTTNEAQYGDWMGQLDDYDFDHLRFQGHSHVNMGASPSSVDKDLYMSITSQLFENDDYYIFMIFNRRGEIWAEVYDCATNTIYESIDVDIEYESSLDEFIADAKMDVQPEVRTVKTASNSKGFKKDTKPYTYQSYDGTQKELNRTSSWYNDPFESVYDNLYSDYDK